MKKIIKDVLSDDWNIYLIFVLLLFLIVGLTDCGEQKTKQEIRLLEKQIELYKLQNPSSDL